MARVSSLVVLSAGILAIFGAGASGATIAYTTSSTTGPGGAAGDLNIGREFVVSNSGITVQDLGIFDNGSDGLARSHDVTLFSIATTGANPTATPLATVNVPAGTSATLDGGFRFAAISPVFLPAGNYAVIAYGTNSTDDPYGDNGVRLSSANANDAGFDPYQFTSSPSPAFPNGGDTGDHSGSSFHFDVGNTVPEPASLGLIGLAAATMLARRRSSAS